MCGGTGAQNSILAGDQSLMQTTDAEAKQVFGENSALYNNLQAAFEPILKAGPDQEGFTGEEKAALNTEATTDTAAEYQKAEAAVRGRGAAAGGGNDYIPSGQDEQLESEVGSAAAGKEAQEKEQITQADYATGRENYEGAVTGLLNSGEVFNPSTALTNAGTNAGSVAGSEANTIQQAGDEWIGALGGLAGDATKAFGSYEAAN